LRTPVGASSNYAKIAYTSPLLFGAQIALSFTPSEGKQFPFLNAGPHVPGRQVEFWEAAVRYEEELGPVTLAGYGAVSESRAEHKRPGQEGTSDLGTGLKADYPLDEETSLSLGGAYRQSNAYGFDVNQTWQAGTTRVGHISTAVTRGPWMVGLEYGTGTADAVSNLPRLGLNGLEASLGYRLSDSIRVSSGWQRLSYSRSAGVFFNGARQLKMDAVFLHLHLNTSEE
jgi:opacity protein-like surface antigen